MLLNPVLLFREAQGFHLNIYYETVKFKIFKSGIMKTIKKYILLLVLATQMNYLWALPDGWSVNSADYQYSLTITATVEVNSETVGNTGNVVAAFVNNECRGVAEASLVQANNTYYFYLTVFSNEYSGDTIRFSYYDKDKDNVTEFAKTVVFTDGDNLGSVSNPYVVTNDQHDGIVQRSGVAALNCYPNPTDHWLTIDTQNPLSAIRLYNVTGKLISTFDPGFDNTIDVSQLPKGIYLIEAESNKTKFLSKFIKE